MTFNELTALAYQNSPTSGNFPPPEKTVAVAGADDEATLGAVEAALKANVGFILVGPQAGIHRKAQDGGIDISQAEILEPEVEGEKETCAAAARLCAQGKAGVLMKGRVGTAAFTRAILDKDIGLSAEDSLLSHTGLLGDPRNERVFLLTDGAINIQQDVETKKKILINAVSVARALGITQPRIVLLAPVEKLNPKIQSTMDAAELAQWVSGGALGTALAEGPLALDVAASGEAARTKGIISAVAGRGDIYLAPGLDAGNVLYKSLTVFAHARAAGILAGANVPVVLTSRSDSKETKQASLGLALRVAAGS